MNTRPSLDRFVTEWLHDDASSAGSERVLAATIDRVSSARQERRRPTTRFAVTHAYATLGLAAAAALVIAAVGISLPVHERDGVGGLATAPSPASQPSSLPATVGAYPGGDPQSNLIATGRHSVTVDGIRLSFDMPYGWESMAPFHMAKSTEGPQDAEAIILWTTIPDSVLVGTAPAFHGAYVVCRDLLGAAVGGSIADFAAVASKVPGTELVVGPADLDVGGRAAKYLSMFLPYSILDHDFCSPGLFVSWDSPRGGAFWHNAIPGDTISVWFVDVDGTRLLIEAATRWNAGSRVQDEIQQIVDSINFE